MVVTLHYYLDVVNCQNQQYIHQRRDAQPATYKPFTFAILSDTKSCHLNSVASDGKSDSVASDGKTA